MRARMERAATPGKSQLTAYRLAPWVASRHGSYRYFIRVIDDGGLANHPLAPYLAAIDDTSQMGVADPDFLDENKENITNHRMDY